MSLKKGMKVRIVTEDPFLSEIKNEVGTVREIYEDMGVVIVKIPEGAAKVPIEFLEEVKEENPANQKPGARRITKEAFETAIDKVIELSLEKSPEERRFSYALARLVTKATGAIIVKDLFENNPEVELTKEELILMLWDKCSPVNIAKHIKVPETDFKKTTLISTISFTYLKDLVGVLFSQDND